MPNKQQFQASAIYVELPTSYISRDAIHPRSWVGRVGSLPIPISKFPPRLLNFSDFLEKINLYGIKRGELNFEFVCLSEKWDNDGTSTLLEATKTSCMNCDDGDGVVGGSKWEDIPVELLLRILSLLDDRTVIVASGVCHGWRDSVSWALTHLSLSWCKRNMNNLVLSLLPKFRKLQVLILRQDSPQLLDDAIGIISSHCTGLQELDLSRSFRLTDGSLYALAHGCPNIVKLNISGCSAFSDSAVGYLSSCCRKLKILNLCGCDKAATDRALKAIGYNCNEMQSLNLGWCHYVGDEGVKSLAYGCPDLRALDLCGCVRITDDSVIALANNCFGLRSLGLYYCQNITDKAMYSLAQSRVKRKLKMWTKEEGLTNLNISQCTALTPPAVQALCDSFPALHTCPGQHSLIISGCLNLTSVHCACAFQAHRQRTLPCLI